jgi:hypothetical protein
MPGDTVERASSATDIERHVDAWSKRDHARALLPVDHEIVDVTRAPRALVVERILAQAPDKDLFHACAMLGRIIAERGGSPTLASCTVDGVQAVLGETNAPWDNVRAALAEGFAGVRMELARREACVAWEYPRCAVPIEPGVVAIAAGYPDDDSEALGGWAARVASASALGGVRRVIVSGRSDAREALVDALTTAGIEVGSSPLASAADESEKSRSWLPWLRARRS